MIKSLMALAILDLLGGAAIAVPGFAPQANADEAVTLASRTGFLVPLLFEAALARFGRALRHPACTTFGQACRCEKLA